jgi:hypothetical protein
MHALALYMYDTGWTLDIGQSICGEECNTISGVPSVRWIRTRDNAASLQAKKLRVNPSQGGQSEHSMAEEPSADSAVPVTHLRLIVNYRSYTPVRIRSSGSEPGRASDRARSELIRVENMSLAWISSTRIDFERRWVLSHQTFD